MSCNNLDITWFAGINELFAEAMAIRTEVFVVEQRVPVELERDHIDEVAIHALLRVDGVYVGTGRVCLDAKTETVAKLGRIAVLKPWRGRGYGLALTRALITIAYEHLGADRVLLHSQVSARAFYEKLGFKGAGKEFMEAGIEHLVMELKMHEL